MALTITYLIMNLIRTYAIYLFIDALLLRKRISKQMVLCAYAVYYIVCTYTYMKAYNVSIIVLQNLLFGYLMGLLYYSKITKRVLATVFIYILQFASDYFALILVEILFQIPYSTTISGNFYTKLGIVISMLSLLLLVLLIRPLFRNSETELPYSYWLAVFLIPSGSIFIIYSLNNYHVNNIAYDLSLNLWITFILFDINVLVFYLYNKLLKEEATKYEVMMLHQQNDIYEKQALLINEFQKELHNQNHDIKNHLISIMEFIESGDSQEAINYVDTLIGNAKEITTSINSGNINVDAMLNSKLYIAKHQDTQLFIKIRILDPLVMKDPADLTIILGNLLDNALEAVTKFPPPKRIIEFYLKYQGNFLIIQVRNIYSPATSDIHDGKAYTTKSNKELHGIGLKRIKNTAEKYDGSFEYQTTTEGEDAFFIAEVKLYPTN